MEYPRWNGRGDVYDWLQSIEAHPKRTSRGWSIRCLNPKHTDGRNSAQLFENDFWWVCYGGCGRFPLLPRGASGYRSQPAEENYQIRKEVVQDTIKADYYDYWLSLEPLTEGIKGIPANHLNKLGWRKLPGGNDLGLPAGIFIPAFTPKRTSIPFCQVRHLEGDRRFSFPSRVKPLAFGMESIPSLQEYVPFTEGNSDRSILEMAGVPAIAIPSGASGALLRDLGRWANDNGKILVACSDRDPVGDKLLFSLDGIAPYIDARPVGYKDIGEMYEAEGLDKIRQEYSWLRGVDTHG